MEGLEGIKDVLICVVGAVIIAIWFMTPDEEENDELR